MKAMEIGDGVLFYHSNAKPPGIAGVAKVCRTAYPDFTQFDADSKYHDPRATREKPWWYMVDIEFVARFPEEIPLPAASLAAGTAGNGAPEARPASLGTAGDSRRVVVPPGIRKPRRTFRFRRLLIGVPTGGDAESGGAARLHWPPFRRRFSMLHRVLFAIGLLAFLPRPAARPGTRRLGRPDSGSGLPR